MFSWIFGAQVAAGVEDRILDCIWGLVLIFDVH
jgi:hypothetical protein